MRLIKFRINNYSSIIDSGFIEISKLDNVLVLAGQNESGKSSTLMALRDFENDFFESDSMPFSTGEKPIQSVSCTYEIEEGDDLAEEISSTIANEIGETDDQKIIDEVKIKKIKEFTITKTSGESNLKMSIDERTFKIFQNSILEKPSTDEDTVAENSGVTEDAGQNSIEEKDNEENLEKKSKKDKFIEIKDDENFKVANYFWLKSPSIVFFDDFCDLLPNKIFISDLKEKKKKVEGYQAVRNLEKILNIDFIKKEEEIDAVRSVNEENENDDLSVTFQRDWGQRIHGENEVRIKYQFQKRNGEGENGSYINFYVETKKGQLLPPKQRSKGLIWFLSLWLELNAQDSSFGDLILLLDEPDQHLHVKAQSDILKLINKLAKGTENEKGDQVIYSTHSPYLIEIDFLSRIKLVLNTEEEGTKIEDIVTSKIDTKYKKDALQPIANAIGLCVSDFSTLKGKNVLLEGLSDYYYFAGMKKLLNKQGDYYFIPGVGVRQINNLISLCIGYGLEWITIIDDDPKEGGKDSEKKFNEIKKFVFDDNEDATKEKVFVLDKIVGIENMFAFEDLKLINGNIKKTGNDNVKIVGVKRKVLFSKLFSDKVKDKSITREDLSQKALDNFEKSFDFIENNFK